MLHGGAGAGARPRLLPRAAGGVISARELAVESACSASGGASVPDGPNERRTSFYISDRQRRQRRDDSAFSAPCKALPTVWRAPQQPETCGARLGYTPSCQPIPGHFVTANRDTSSKPPRFIRRWRRFGDSPPSPAPERNTTPSEWCFFLEWAEARTGHAPLMRITCTDTRTSPRSGGF